MSRILGRLRVTLRKQDRKWPEKPQAGRAFSMPSPENAPGKTNTTATIFYAGIDVSKTRLDLAIPGAKAQQFANDTPGISALVETLNRAAAGRPYRTAFEPTGRMHLALWRALDEASLGPVPVNPYRARLFAEADGRLAKTDALDAAMLARAAEALDLAERPAPSEEALRIRELLRNPIYKR